MRRLLVLTTVIIMLCGVFSAKISFAVVEEDKITVISRQQSIDYAKRILIFEGEVRASWEKYLVEADKAEVYLTAGENLEKIIATGNVKITDDTGVQGTCQIVTYMAQENLLILEGSVTYQDGLGNNIEAQKVTIWTREEILKAEGDPVKAVYMFKTEE